MTDPFLVAGLVAAGVSALVVVAFQLQPGLWPPDVYFGVTVRADFPTREEGRAIVRRYRVQIWLHASVAAVLIFTSVSTRSSPFLLFAGVLLPIAGATMAFVTAHRATTPFGVPPASVREVELGPPPSLPGGILGQMGPFLAIGVAMAYAAMAWDRIPDRFPIHWNLAGQANGYATKSFFGVFGLALIGMAVCGVLLITSAGIAYGSRLSPTLGRGRQSLRVRQINLMVLLGTEYLLAVTFGWVTIALPFRFWR